MGEHSLAQWMAYCLAENQVFAFLRKEIDFLVKCLDGLFDMGLNPEEIS